MDRVIVYEGEIPYEEDLLQTNRFAMVCIAKLAQAILGTNTLVNGLACTPTAPASMEVQVAPGEIYSLQNLDESAYSSLPADIDHPILKQGLMLDAGLFACSAPATSGHSIDYLVQAAYLDVDAEPAVLPYYDTNHPDHPYSGPNNSGEAQATVRKGICHVSIKAGVAAQSGQQRPPAPDAGSTGLYLITVAHGQTTITEQDIRLTPDAPFITETLTQKISHADVDKRYAHKATTLAGYGITDAVNVEEKGQPEGVATLNAQGHVPTEQLPRSAGAVNLLINGDFTINQRGYRMGSLLSSYIYGFDRWKAGGRDTYLNWPTNGLTGVHITRGTLEQIVEAESIDGGTVGRVKLEPGVIATPWARRLFADELQLCQRYYEKSYRPFTAPGAVEYNAGNPNAILLQGLGFLFGVPFKVTKRVPPAVTIYRPSTGSAGWIERANEVDPLLVIHLESSENGIGLIILNRGPDRNDLYQYQWSADAEL